MSDTFNVLMNYNHQFEIIDNMCLELAKLNNPEVNAILDKARIDIKNITDNIDMFEAQNE